MAPTETVGKFRVNRGISDFTTYNNQSDCSISFNYSINKIKKPQVKGISHYFGAQEKLNKYL